MSRPQMFWNYLPTFACEMPVEVIDPEVDLCELPAVASIEWENDPLEVEPMYVCEKHLRQIIEDEKKAR
jgi:hypothetical protein